MNKPLRINILAKTKKHPESKHIRDSQLKTRLFLLLLLTFVSTPSVFAWTVELTEDELQQKINKRVPIEKKKLIFTVLVSAIDVELKDGSDRIGLIANMEVRSPHLSSGKGRAWLDGKLKYEPTDGSFYFIDPQVRDVKFENIPARYHLLVQNILQRALSQRLSNTAVYKLDANNTKQKIARTLLKSVRVADKKLFLELGLI